MNGFEQLYPWLALLDLKALAQITLLVLLIGWSYQQFIRGSQAEQLLKGVFVVLLSLIAGWFSAQLFDLPILAGVCLASIFILLIGLIVIFQPELRRTLLYLGQGELFGSTGSSDSPESRKPEYLVRELCEAVHFLSKSKRGALIVLESAKNPGSDYLEVGTALDAKLSTELLLTIFHPNTPLHDGAVIISPENRIRAAGVLLPLTENPELSWQFGTRHRAAIGLTETSDSRCLVVSEETGHISMVHAGHLDRIETVDELRKTLEKLYHVSIKADAKSGEKFRKKLTGIFAIGDLPDRIQKMFRNPGSDKNRPAVKKSGTNG